MIKADLHNHLGRNGDNPGFDETIDIAHARLGNGGIFGIANCDDFRYEAFVEQKGGKYHRVNKVNDAGYRVAIHVPEKDIIVVKCQEMFTEDGDILAIVMPNGKGVRTKDAKDAIKEARDFGAVLDAVHPFYLDGAGKFLEKDDSILRLFSTWEVYNGSAVWIPLVTPRDANQKAFEFYISNFLEGLFPGIGMSASTDGHSAGVIGKSYTMLDDYLISNPNIREGLENALRNVKTSDRLHMQSNRIDALKHGFDMGLEKIGLRK